MKSSDYWRGRFIHLEEAANREAASLKQELEQQFKIAQREIEDSLNAWYQRFATNNQIDMVEARRLLTTKELAEFKWDVKEYIKYGQDIGLHPSYMKQLENASARFHISRLEALKIQTRHSLETLYGKQIGSVDKVMKRLYEQGYYHTAYELQKGFNVGWGIASIDDKKLEKIIKKPWAADGRNFSDRIWDNKSKLVNELHTELTQTAILGKSPDDAIKNISRKMNTSKNNAGRLVMTEQAYFSSQAQKDCFSELEVEKFEIVATLDNHTSELCQDMDGKVFNMKDYEPGVTAPPFHVWCRSVIVPYFDDEFTLGEERAARDEKTGETYYVPGNMKYGEWKEKFADEGLKSYDYTKIKEFHDTHSTKSYFNSDDKYVEWKNSLDKSELEAVSEYTSNNYKQINSYNRKTDLWAEDGQHANNLKEAELFMKNAPKVEPQKAGESFFAYRRRKNAAIPIEYQSAISSKATAEKNTKLLDDIIGRFKLDDNMKVYRGVDINALPRFEKIEELIGTSYSDASFMSTAPVLAPTHKKDYVLEMLIQKGDGRGAYLEELTAVSGENEFLLARNSKFKITGVRKEGAVNYVQMEMVP